jgi:molecular chaperone HscA
MGRIGINIATGSLLKEEIIVGIDLGTTHSLIAFVHPEEKRPVILKEQDNSSLVPSVIYFDELNNPIVGDRAKDHLVTDPARTIFSAKRLMGKSYADLKENTGNYAYRIIDDKKEGMVKVQAGDKIYSPVELSSFILKELKAEG